jgi:uncharacterized protein
MSFASRSPSRGSPESVLTLISYAALGLLTRQSGELARRRAPGVLIGIPLGQALIRTTGPETFRRVCMSVDAWLVGFGLSRMVAELGIVPSFAAYQILAATLLIDAVLLRRFSTRPSVACSDATSRCARDRARCRRPASWRGLRCWPVPRHYSPQR